jgi:hypothetical protein
MASLPFPYVNLHIRLSIWNRPNDSSQNFSNSEKPAYIVALNQRLSLNKGVGFHLFHSQGYFEYSMSEAKPSPVETCAGERVIAGPGDEKFKVCQLSM